LKIYQLKQEDFITVKYKFRFLLMISLENCLIQFLYGNKMINGRILSYML
jgi:hypothetical protein